MTEFVHGLQLSDDEKRLLDKTPDSEREARLQQRLLDIESLDSAPTESHALQWATLALEIAALYLDLGLKDRAGMYARQSVDRFIANNAFEDAALACQYVYLADHPDAIAAIGQAAWLSVTYPVDPHLTANILNHIIDETPDHSDGGAVAAATAHYVVDMRSTETEHEELKLFTGTNLARVASRHSNIKTQQEFELWVERLELDDPEKFLVRLRNVVDVMVQTDWWFDREACLRNIPDEPA